MKNEKVPQLRFTQFSNEWKQYKLDTVTSKIQDGTHFSPDIIEAGDYKYITSKNIRNGYMTLDNISYISDKEHKKIYKRCDVQYKDVLITKDGASTGNVCLNELEEEFSLLSSVAFLRAEPSKTTNEFIYQYIVSPRGQREIKKVISGQAITRITLTKLRNFKFNYPSLEEQNRITNFLSSVDQKIQQLRRKKELLDEYKKGVMQKLLSQEIRFKDENGEDFPDWEEYNVDKFLKLFVTNSFSRNDLTYESGKVKNIHYGDIHSEFKMGFKVNEETVPYIVENKKLSKYDEDQYVKPGDLIIADASEDYVDIGKAIEVLETGDDKILAGLHTIHARDKKPLTVVGFKGYLFRSESVRKQLKRVSQGASVLGISKGNFKEIYVNLPCLAEQQKIVEFLQNIDKNIARVESKIEKFQTFKKGLLQQMFV